MSNQLNQFNLPVRPIAKAELRAFVQLNHHPGSVWRMAELVKTTGLTAGVLSSALRKLVSNGYVTHVFSGKEDGTLDSFWCTTRRGFNHRGFEARVLIATEGESCGQ